MPIKNKNLFPGAFWLAPQNYIQIGTNGTGPLLLVGWTGSAFGVGEPLVTSPATNNPQTESLGVSELDSLLGHGSTGMSIKITKDPDTLRQKGKNRDRYDR